MSISFLTEAGIPDATMQYEEGGRVCVWRWAGGELPAETQMGAVKEAIQAQRAVKAN